MNWAKSMQVFQDWFTQQWVIFRGKKISKDDYSWLLGPFGNVNGIGEDFIYQLADKENLIVDRSPSPKGLISSFELLNLSKEEKEKLSPKVVDFYERTSQYALHLDANWNPFFIPFGWLVNRLFSNRINQLNIPLKNNKETGNLKSELITLVCSETQAVKYTFWLRKNASDNKIMYSGIYTTCKIESGKSCVKAIFPLPQGNATVIMEPKVTANGGLSLNSSGQKLGDAGFYFLLKDSKENYWAQFIQSFRDELVIEEVDNHLLAKQNLTLYNFRVLTLNYTIK
jgi:hypothetical protein